MLTGVYWQFFPHSLQQKQKQKKKKNHPLSNHFYHKALSPHPLGGQSRRSAYLRMLQEPELNHSSHIPSEGEQAHRLQGPKIPPEISAAGQERDLPEPPEAGWFWCPGIAQVCSEGDASTATCIAGKPSKHCEDALSNLTAFKNIKKEKNISILILFFF